MVAVDVGTHQLHERLRADPRVECREQTDIRAVTTASLDHPVDLVVADLSFISLRLVLPTLASLAGKRPIVALVKPQFEAGRAEVSKGNGVVRDPAIWLRVLEEVAEAATEANRTFVAVVPSPITGSAGNVEFIAYLAPRAPTLGAIAAEDDRATVSQMLADVVARVEARSR